MASQNAEFTRKLRAAVKAKLEEYGLEVDEELPDYVMIMVGNKKDKVRMKADLKLFLADNTSPFVEWLFDFFQKVKTVTSSGVAGDNVSSSTAVSALASQTTSDTHKEKDAKHHHKRQKSESSLLPVSKETRHRLDEGAKAAATTKKESRNTIVAPPAAEAKKSRKESVKSEKLSHSFTDQHAKSKPAERGRRDSKTSTETASSKKRLLKREDADTEKSVKVHSHHSTTRAKPTTGRDSKDVTTKAGVTVLLKSAEPPAKSSPLRATKRTAKRETPSREEKRPRSRDVVNINHDEENNEDKQPKQTMSSKIEAVLSDELSPQRKVASKVVVMRHVNEKTSQLCRGSSNIFKRAISEAASVSAGYGGGRPARDVKIVAGIGAGEAGKAALRRARDINIDYGANENESAPSKKRRSDEEKLPRLLITYNLSAKRRVISEKAAMNASVDKDADYDNLATEALQDDKDHIVVNSEATPVEGETIIAPAKRQRRSQPVKSALLAAACEAAANTAFISRATRKRPVVKKLSAEQSDDDGNEFEEGGENRLTRKLLRGRVVSQIAETANEDDQSAKRQRPQILPPVGVAGRKPKAALHLRNRRLLDELGDDELASAIEKAIKRQLKDEEDDEEDDDEAAIDFMLHQLKRRKRNRSLARTLLRLSDLSPKMVRVLKGALDDGDLEEKYDPTDDGKLFDKLKRCGEKGGSENQLKRSYSSGMTTPAWDGQINLDVSSSDDEAEIDALLASANETRAVDGGQPKILQPTELPPPTAVLSLPSALRNTATADRDAFAALGYNPAQYQTSFTPPIGRESSLAMTSAAVNAAIPTGVVLPSPTSTAVVALPHKVSVDRCRFWPDCRNEDVCPFHHPSKPCSVFPNCWFGDKCLFVHPPCKFGINCHKPKCTFTHYKTVPPSVVAVTTTAAASVIGPKPSGGNLTQVYGGATCAMVSSAALSATITTVAVSKPTVMMTASASPLSSTTAAISSTTPASIVTTAGSTIASVTPSVPLSGPTIESTLPQSTIACRYGGRCQNTRCTYKHPPLCRFGANCLNANCYFLHRKAATPSVPTKSALSKCYNTGINSAAATNGNAKSADTKAADVNLSETNDDDVKAADEPSVAVRMAKVEPATSSTSVVDDKMSTTAVSDVTLPAIVLKQEEEVAKAEEATMPSSDVKVMTPADEKPSANDKTKTDNVKESTA